MLAMGNYCGERAPILEHLPLIDVGQLMEARQPDMAASGNEDGFSG